MNDATSEEIKLSSIFESKEQDEHDKGRDARVETVRPPQCHQIEMFRLLLVLERLCEQFVSLLTDAFFFQKYIHLFRGSD